MLTENIMIYITVHQNRIKTQLQKWLMAVTAEKSDLSNLMVSMRHFLLMYIKIQIIGDFEVQYEIVTMKIYDMQ